MTRVPNSRIHTAGQFTDQRRAVGTYDGTEVIVYKYWFHEPDDHEVIVFTWSDRGIDPRGSIVESWTRLTDAEADDRFESLLEDHAIEEVPVAP